MMYRQCVSREIETTVLTEKIYVTKKYKNGSPFVRSVLGDRNHRFDPASEFLSKRGQITQQRRPNGRPKP